MIRPGLALLLLTACDSATEVRPLPVPIPSELQYHGVRLANVDPSAPITELFVYDDDVVDATPGHDYDAPRLFVESGRSTEGGYEGSDVVISQLEQSFWSSHWVVLERCTGTLRHADGAWTIALSGSPSCVHWNGTFRPEAPSAGAPAAPVVASAPAPLSLVLPPPTTPFARALAGLDRWQPSDAPCPVALRAPDAEVAGGARPGEAALHHAGEATGEPFEVVRATSGAALPSEAASSRRYQVLYVRTEHREPSIEDAYSFSAGRSAGRAFLIDTAAGRVVCVGDVAARNGEAITGASDREAEMWLVLQLQIAEERAIALGLHAIAPDTAD